MTREQAINYLISSGFSDEQVSEVVRALTYEPTPKNDLGVDKTDMIDKSNFSQEQYKADLQSAYDCGYEQAKNDLGVDCISRKQAIEEADKLTLETGYDNEKVIEMLEDLPSVTPQEPILDKIYADIQKLRGCSCSCSDGIIDDVEDILDKYKGEQEET